MFDVSKPFVHDVLGVIRCSLVRHSVQRENSRRSPASATLEESGRKKSKHEEAGKRGRLESQAKFKTKSEAKASLVRAAKDNIYLLQ